METKDSKNKTKASSFIRYTKNSDLEDSKMSESSISKVSESEEFKRIISIKKGASGTNNKKRHPKNGKIIITCDNSNDNISNGGKNNLQNDFGVIYDYEGIERRKNEQEFKKKNIKNNRNIKNNENNVYYSYGEY